MTLAENDIDAAGAESLAGALKSNHTLTSIDLSRNDIDAAGAESLASALKSNHTLTSLVKYCAALVGAESLAGALKPNNTLTSIDLSWNDIDAAGAESLALALTSNNTLTSIDLSRNDIDAAGAESLASALTSNDTLTSINLSYNGIKAAGAESLVGALTSSHTLASIGLRGNSIKAAGAKALAFALKYNGTLTSIDLSNNYIKAAGAESLAGALKSNHALTSISLSENHIDAVGAESLASALTSNDTLTSIGLSVNSIDAVGAESLAGALKSNNTLTSISLSENHIDAAGTKALALALKFNHTLTSIDLSGNHIGAAGVESLAGALTSNHALTSIDLGWNGIDAAGAKALALALKFNHTLTSIDLSGNHIDAAGAESLAGALKSNDTLTSIDLSCNGIDAAGAKALALALRFNHTLTSIDLSGNHIDAAGAESMAGALKSNDTLTSINLSDNDIKKTCMKTVLKRLAEALDNNTTLTNFDISGVSAKKRWLKADALLRRNRQPQQKAQQRLAKTATKAALKAKIANLEQRLNVFSAIEAARNHGSSTISGLLHQCDTYWRDETTDNKDIAEKILRQSLAIMPGTPECEAEYQQQERMSQQILHVCQEAIDKEREIIRMTQDKIDQVGLQVSNRDKIIATLQEKIAEHTVHLREIQAEIGERIKIKQLRNQLFEVDSERHGYPLHAFYSLMYNRLTSVAVGLHSVRSGFVKSAKYWKDELGDVFITGLSLGVSAALGIATLGAAAPLIPVDVAGMDMAGKKLVGRWRQKGKEKQLKQGVVPYSQGVLDFDATNMTWAYALTYYLQDKLLYCKPKGIQCIADTLLTHIIYQITKEAKQTEQAESSDNLSSDTIDAECLAVFGMGGINQKIKNTFLKGKSVSTFIDETNSQYSSWILKSVLTKGGYAYAKNSELLFCDIEARQVLKSTANEKAEQFELVKFCRPGKYGYFYFHNEKSANRFLEKQSEKANEMCKKKALQIEMRLQPTSKKGPPQLLSSVVELAEKFGELKAESDDDNIRNKVEGDPNGNNALNIPKQEQEKQSKKTPLMYFGEKYIKKIEKLEKDLNEEYDLCIKLKDKIKKQNATIAQLQQQIKILTSKQESEEKQLQQRLNSIVCKSW